MSASKTGSSQRSHVPSSSNSRPTALIVAVIVLGVIAAASITWRLLHREGAATKPVPAAAATVAKTSAEPAAAPSAGQPAPSPGSPPAATEKTKANVPVEWNSDYHRFFPLAPGNTWTYRGRNSRGGGENFEYTWHISQRVARGQATLYLVELYRNGQYRDRFLFSSDNTGLYRYGSPDDNPGTVIPYPALPGTKWQLGSQDIRIVGTADVTTPAGHFPNALQVCMQEKGKPGDPFWTAAYEYFVPGIGRVKSESLAHHDGVTDTLRADLAGYQVKSE